MNSMHKRNFIRMAHYLWSLPQEQFDMKSYLLDEQGNLVMTYEHECGSVGCVIGHSLEVEGMEGMTDYDTWRDVAMSLFGEAILGDNYGEFIFSSFWRGVDNTPRGAAKRIILVLNNNGLGLNSFDPSIYQHWDISNLPELSEV